LFVNTNLVKRFVSMLKQGIAHHLNMKKSRK